MAIKDQAATLACSKRTRSSAARRRRRPEAARRRRSPRRRRRAYGGGHAGEPPASERWGHARQTSLRKLRISRRKRTVVAHARDEAPNDEAAHAAKKGVFEEVFGDRGRSRATLTGSIDTKSCSPETSDDEASRWRVSLASARTAAPSRPESTLPIPAGPLVSDGRRADRVAHGVSRRPVDEESRSE